MFVSSSKGYEKIPGLPIAYWATRKVKNIFERETLLGNIVKPCIGMRTGDNKRFLRYWYETDYNKIGFSYANREEAKNSNKKWFPYNKGGIYRKWYGNNEYLVNWENDGKEIKKNTRQKYPELGDNLGWKISNEKYYFKESITWSFVGGSRFGVRYSSKGFIFDVGGSSIFPKKENMYYLMSFLCSKVAYEFLMILNPTFNFQIRDISNLPIIFCESNKKDINKLAEENINISKTDWDSFEISWDFKKHPLLTHKKDAKTIEEAFNNWSEFAKDQFYQLKENEEELNRTFIDIYGLEDELTPEVPEKDVTVCKADRGRDITSFMSYAVGCMMGRYSLDEDGLVYAGGEFDKSRYKTFEVDEDGIIPVLDDEYFDDDIVAKFVEFVKVTFGEDYLEENLKYIADSLIESGTSGQKTPRETIRRYFLFDFIKDHVSTYNKRPIYWLFQSDGRGKAFNALIYMHRYDKNTVARVRTDYLHELQKKIEAEKVRLQGIIDSDLSTREKNEAKKKLKKLEKNTKELREYDEKLNHLANQQIEIDLDDGVKENYKKFDEVLKNI